jgi:hypothetical protein
MSKKKSQPKYLIIYRCNACGQDSAFTEREDPYCRFCNSTKDLAMISKQVITREVMMARLKVVSDRMMENLTKAYEQLPTVGENIVAEGTDAESMLLHLLAHAKRLRDKLNDLDSKDANKNENQ